MKSIYGFITDGQRITDRTHKDNLEYLHGKCVEHVKDLGLRKE